MAKLTADIFAQLPEEMQQQILKEVPLHHLNNIEVLGIDDLDTEATIADMQELITGLSRKKCLTIIIELINAISQKMVGLDAPPEIRMAASLAILKQTIAIADKHMQEFGGQEDD